MVKSSVWVLLEICLLSSAKRILKLKFDEVAMMSLVSGTSFLGHSVVYMLPV